MTADLTRLHGLRQRAGMTEVALTAFELDHPDSHLVPALRERHNKLLLENIESKNALEIEMAIRDGRLNFRPEKKKQKSA